MKKRGEKLIRATHIKQNTEGTSNEISFSVLDAAKNSLEGDGNLDTNDKGAHLAGISLFTLPLRKKAVATPKREQGLLLSSGEFISTEEYANSGGALPGKISLESSQGSSVGGVIGLSGLSSSTNSVGTGGFSAAIDGSVGMNGGGYASLSAAWRAPGEEIARRKALRKHRQRLTRVIGILVLAAIVVGVGWWALQNYQTHQSHVSELNQAVQLINRSDEVVLSLDEAISSLLALPAGEVADDDLLVLFDELPHQLAGSAEELQSAESLAWSAAEGMSDSSDKEAANQAILAIHGRQGMIDTGNQLMVDAVAASSAATSAQEAWSLLLSADKISREAALLVTNTTIDNVNESIKQTNQAIDLFNQADNKFFEASKEYKAADFAAYHSYIDKRIEAMHYAIASDEAFLAKNKEELAAQNEEYNRTDAEAATLAKDLSDEPWSMVAEASIQETEELRSAYSTARAQVGSADAFLRDYLGLSG